MDLAITLLVMALVVLVIHVGVTWALGRLRDKNWWAVWLDILWPWW
jgi:hypothetical protein